MGAGTPKRILAADIGGTSSRFADFELSAGGLTKRNVVWLKTDGARSLGDLLAALPANGFNLTALAADLAVFAIAGPIEEGVFSKPPNIDWSVDLRSLGEFVALNRSVLINDFLAQAFAPLSEVGTRALLILEGSASARGTIAVIGAGTGLGKAFLVPDGRGGFVGAPSEGGHANFAPETAREQEFANFLTTRFAAPFAEWEFVVSGPGLSALHEFLSGESLSPKDVAAKFATAPETLAWFARFYGRVCRCFALETLALGGLYIAGGVAAKNPEIVRHPEFAREFRSSKTMAEILARIEVKLVDDEESGLWGAAAYAVEELRRRG